MKIAKPAQMNSDLLASKGAAVPSNADRESLGPGSVDKAVSGAQAHAVSAVGAAPATKPADTKSKRGGRVNLSVRLDPDRHRRLKLATIHLDETAQNIMIMALDAYMDQIANDLVAISRGFVDSEQLGEQDDLVSGEPDSPAGLE